MHHPTNRITHTMAFVTPVVEHWLEREIAQWVHPMKDRSDDPLHHERMLLQMLLSCSIPFVQDQKKFKKLREIRIVSDIYIYIYIYRGSRKEGNILFNNALNLFFFVIIWHQLYKLSERTESIN